MPHKFGAASSLVKEVELIAHRFETSLDRFLDIVILGQCMTSVLE